MGIDYKKIASDVLDTEIHAIKKLYEVFKEKNGFCEAVDLLSNSSGRAIISGIGKSGIVAKKIAATFSSIGKASHFLHAAEASHGDLGIINNDDIVIIISNSGESLEIFGVIEFCKQLKIPIIAIVGKSKSTLAKNSDVTICMPDFKEVSHIAMPTTSTTLVSIIGDALAACLVESRTVTFEKYKSYHPGGNIGQRLKKVRDIMRKGDKIPLVKKDTLMLDALMVMTSCAMGCLVVIDDNSEVLGMITDGDLRRHMSDNLLSMYVHEIMTENPKSIGLEDMAMDALKFMNKKQITNLLVLDNGKPVGIIHVHDCLREGLE